MAASLSSQVAVMVQRLYRHSKFRKFIKHRKKYLAHDHHEICGIGDRVQIKYVGRQSKRKAFAVIDMIHRQPRMEGEPFPMSVPTVGFEAEELKE